MEAMDFLIILHIIGTALGAGGATVSDFLFFKTIRRGIIDETSFNVFKTVSFVVWIGFIILVFSGFGFFIDYRLGSPEDGLIYNPKLWAKLVVVLVILFNGIVMHAKVFPFFESSIGKPISVILEKGRLIFSTGAISITSWYSAIILGAWHDLNLSFFSILVIYLIILFVAILAANLIGRKMLK